MMLFSIKVALVMGNFSAVPKQAHCIDFLFINVLVTPMVVVPKMIKVITKAIGISIRIKNIIPNATSMNGYIQL